LNVIAATKPNLGQLVVLSAVSWALACVTPWALLALLYSLEVTPGDIDLLVAASNPLFAGGVLQALVLTRLYRQLKPLAATGYALCWVLGGVTALGFLGFTPALPALFAVMSGWLLGAVASSIWLKWALPGRNWEDTLWAIGGWVAGWGMGLGGLFCGAFFVLFAELEDDPVAGFFGFVVMGAIAGAVGAGALEWPDNGRGAATAPEIAAER
jgi:hypothetical protein